MLRLFNLVFALMSKSERKRLAMLFIAIVIMGFLEVASISSIMPFMAVVGNPEAIYTNFYLNSVYEYIGQPSEQYFLMLLGVLALFMLLIGNSFTAFTIWLLLRFSNMQEHFLAVRLLRKYLYKPYPFFIKHNTGELSKNIINEVNRVVIGVLIPGIQALAKAVVAIFIVSLLFVVDFILALSVSVTLGSAYSLFYYFIRKKLYKRGTEATDAAKKRFIAANEAFGSIKDIKLSGKEEDFIRRFSGPSYRNAVCMTESKVYAQLPKYAFEAIAFGGILMIVLYLLAIKKDMAYVMPIISIYAFSGYRLMNAMHIIFWGASECRYNSPALEILYRDLTADNDVGEDQSKSGISDNIENGNIRLQGITYKYPDAKTFSIRNVSLEISKDSVVGIIGPTGSGKTTIIDIIMGLLTPDSGMITVDGVPVVVENIKSWQKHIGYVPQSIYLTDDTIAQNIALGESPENIDMGAVEKAARLANIHNLVLNETPNGYQTVIGENGVKLSGGQRQRIGIARAMYRNPSVLVMDEATSALDHETENLVMEAIQRLSSKVTIILVAHRLTTLTECDVVHVIDRGELIASGSHKDKEFVSKYLEPSS